ncbi:EPIDERMAL PATTERNING FACTOR-like protein 8 [Hibiscus syriacus]|nr:EPIDERMAL PATTERNING FACTOR-like protein 8 [Hibiscus syriacus]
MPSGFAVNSGGLQQSETVLGSKPPSCVNKCLSCRPCMATLVIPTHKWKKNFEKVTYRGDEDESYYLLAWKCKCGDALFQP